MRTKARKIKKATARRAPRRNLALKVAILERDLTQREAARRSGIPEVRLSSFVRGHGQPTELEQIALANVLGLERASLFPVGTP